ncbi:MAG TPA: hypothetical protein VJ864_04660 [Candidatus Binatia bacterium]|jgi:hypothetical protein|nr:hypothetical protein [Candidatus Binatia bacterium]
MIVENIIGWFLFVLASTCTLSFASTIYDDFISRKRNRRDTATIDKIARLADPGAEELAPKTRRGYDSPELFREDLWIRRIELSRKEHAVLTGWLPGPKVDVKTREDYPKRLCEILASYAAPLVTIDGAIHNTYLS